MSRILLVEDEFLIRLTLTEVLGDEGFDVTEAEDGEQAVALLDGNEAFDLVMTDVNLPGKVSGWAVADAARRERADLPVVFVSGGAEPPAGRCESPHDAFVQKPYTPSDLAAMARRLVGQT
jgi:CheY-like chemotaxis protein